MYMGEVTGVLQMVAVTIVVEVTVVVEMPRTVAARIQHTKPFKFISLLIHVQVHKLVGLTEIISKYYTTNI